MITSFRVQLICILLDGMDVMGAGYYRYMKLEGDSEFKRLMKYNNDPGWYGVVDRIRFKRGLPSRGKYPQ